MLINIEKLKGGLSEFRGAIPFDHCVIDDFFCEGVAEELEAEFLSYDDSRWFFYNNAVENKKAISDWNLFPGHTYRALCELNSDSVISVLRDCLGIDLYQDPGLHGGGWHIHGSGGNLNPHLDYSIHPKLKLQRKLNVIVYLSSELREEHGGHLGFWSNDQITGGPANLTKEVFPKFNRAVIFDTTQDSWHGMSRQLVQPQGIFRKSLAVYYLTEPSGDVSYRERALFAPREDQRGNDEVEELIKLRSDSKLFSSVYRSKKK